MDFDGLPSANGVNFLVSLAFDVDPFDRRAEQQGQILPHSELVRREFGPLENHRRVKIRHRPTRRDGTAHSLGQKLRRIPPGVARIRIRKQLPDVRQGQGPEDCIGGSVIERITIGVADGAVGVLEFHPRKNQWFALARGCN